MVPGVRARLLLAVLTVLAAAPAQAHALSLSADHPERGWIRLGVSGTDGSTVDLAEQTTAGQEPIAEVTLAGGRAVVRHAEIWRCDRYVRHFVATATAPDGTMDTAGADVRTPSCRRRLTIAAHVTKRRRVAVRLTDRFGVGDVSPRLCITRPGRNEVCRAVFIAPGKRRALRSYPARGPGLWSLTFQTAWKQRAPTVHAYIRNRGKLHLLATGDSMIQVLDLDLRRRLAPRGFKVRSDARVSTGLSKPSLLNWPKHAKAQARGVRPDVTVVYIGANDGFPFGKIDCCGEAWVNAYETRVQSMMAAYSRRGRGVVYWLTLPAPRPAQWRPIYPAINRAIKRAAAGFAGQVRVVDVAKVISPGFSFRPTIVWHGLRQSVRAPDGVHLSPAGDSIAELLIQRALRADGVL